MGRVKGEQHRLEMLFARTITDQRGCWLWQGALRGKGYAATSWRDRPIEAHRLVWILIHGEPPPKLEVCHTCDVRHCINPEHLWLGTRKQNAQDAVCKGRTAVGDKNGARRPEERLRRSLAIRGDRHPSVLYPELIARGEQLSNKFTEAHIVAIRLEYAKGRTTHERLAVKHMCSRALITLIVNRKIWRHVA